MNAFPVSRFDFLLTKFDGLGLNEYYHKTDDSSFPLPTLRNVMTCLRMSDKFEMPPDLVEPRTRARKQPRMGNYDGLDVSDFLCKYGKILDGDGADLDYRKFVLRLIAAEMGAEADRNPRERDEEYDDYRHNEEKEEEDPDYTFLLSHLEASGMSCILTYEDKGSSHVIKFEEAMRSESEHDEVQRRKLSVMEKKAGPSSKMPLLQNKSIQETNEYERDWYGRSSTKKKVPRSTTLQNKPRSKKEDDDIMHMDPEYLIFNNELKFVADHLVYQTPDRERIVYEMRDGGFNQVKEEPYDGSYSDVEILDSTGKKEVRNPNVFLH